MDQNNTPKFEPEPYQPSSTGPQETPAPEGGAPIFDQNFQPAPGPTFSPPPPAYTPSPAFTPPAQPPKSNSRRIWLIVLIVVLVLCCCCLAVLGIAWFSGDSIVAQMCAQDPTLPICTGY